ncbi:MAG: hybrid sensor histidine kinase/response regulator [Ignavibacteriaceae bacterium]|jgi:two-component system chemotaxis sensor kinase CheA
MKEQNNDFLKRLLATFKAEAADHIKSLSSGLIELEKAADLEIRAKIIEKIFREAHSLKGAARAVNNSPIERICQSMEGVFASLKKKDIDLKLELIDLLHKATGKLEEILESLSAEDKQVDEKSTETITNKLDDYLKDAKRTASKDSVAVEPAVQKESSAHTETLTTDTIRVAISKLDSLFLQAEEMISLKMLMMQKRKDFQDIKTFTSSWKKEKDKILSDIHVLQHLIEEDKHQNAQQQLKAHLKKVLEFIDWENTYFRTLEEKLITIAKASVNDQLTTTQMVDNLLDDAKQIVMFPFTSLLEIFPTFVRELSRDQGKNVELVIEGAEIEIDRRILEEMKSPLIHLVRNCIDHGIENPEKRNRKKKQDKGTIKISVSQKNGDKVEIIISDDGAGIDPEKIRLAVVKNGIISKDESKKLTIQELHTLIFQSGVSTSPIITDVSGRGLGLAIVREKVEKLGGSISFNTGLDAGTTFHITLPLTLATYRGLLVKAAEHNFIIPITNLERVVSFKKEETRSIENRETILLNGEVTSLVKLTAVLEMSDSQTVENSTDTLFAVVLRASGKRIAFLVNEILNEQEVLVKSLGPQLSRVRNIAGATVLGTGAVVPILNVTDLINSALHISSGIKSEIVPYKKKEEKKKSVLVAEDSITARSLLKNILETAGYRVTTAVDGVDAYTQLKSGDFDLVVSDVDMPRMNGFDLTAKIRSDKKFAEIPVILVTALESREDKEHGIEAGANAYIVKSSFDRGNLLAAIERLL